MVKPGTPTSEALSFAAHRIKENIAGIRSIRIFHGYVSQTSSLGASGSVQQLGELNQTVAFQNAERVAQSK
jgi:hypothetical protein